jgi:hypothetical protein
LVDDNISEKHTVSIFRAEVAMQGSEGIYIGFEDGRLREWANQGRGMMGESAGPIGSLQALKG